MAKGLLAGALALLLVLVLPRPLAAESLRLSGASQVFAGVFFPHKAELERMTGIQLDLRSSRSIEGVRDLVAGKADLAMISNDLPGIVDAINAVGPERVDIAKLVESQIAETEVAFIVNEKNPVNELRREALAGLLSGKITNWSEVGGLNQPVLVIAAPSGGIYPDIEDALLRPLGLGWSRDASAMSNVVLITRAVAQAPNALSYFGPLSGAPGANAIKILKTDLRIVEPLTLVSLGSPSPAAQRLIEAARMLARR